jgi:hypothetical protein
MKRRKETEKDARYKDFPGLDRHHTIKAYKEEEVQLHTFLSTVQDASKLSVSRLHRLTPEESAPITSCIWG